MDCRCWQGFTVLQKRAATKHGVADISNGRSMHLKQMPARQTACDPLYAWIDEGGQRSEKDKIILLRESLTPQEADQLASEPPHIKHDLMLCRFLRGHQHKVPTALKALRAHLKLRRKHRSFLSQVLASVPADREDFDAELSPMADSFRKIKMLQSPGRCGTNDGMPLSLLALGRFKVADLIAFDDEELALWFLSLVEIRCLCLHNQSMRERRMVRVVEVRDCVGVDWTQFLTAPGMLRKLPRMIEIALAYPELVGSALMFNMDPRSKVTWAIRNMTPKNIREKIIFANRGNWDECMCVKRGLSPEAVIRWSQYLQEWNMNAYRQLLTPNELQGVRAIPVSAGDMFSWRVRCGLGSDCDRTSSPSVHISLHIFTKTQQSPTHEILYAEKHCMDVVCNGSLQAPADGVALLEVELIGRKASDAFVALVLGTSAALDSLEREYSLSQNVTSRNEKTALDREGSHCRDSQSLRQSLTWFVVVFLCFFFACRHVPDLITALEQLF